MSMGRLNYMHIEQILKYKILNLLRAQHEQTLTEEQKSFLSCGDMYVQQVSPPRWFLISIKMDSRLGRSVYFVLTLLETSEVGGG